MRTKTLLIVAASALAAAVTSSQAQTVYSANVVGYANLALTPDQYELVSPTFDLDGTGTNGTITTVVGTNVAVNTTVLAWNGAGYDTLVYESPKKGSPVNWQLQGVGADPTYTLNAGEGFFIDDPSDTNLTVEGNVLSGSVTNNYVPAADNYNLLGSKIPYGGDITTNLNYIPSVNDTVLTWNGNGFNTYVYESPKKGSPVAWQLQGVGAQDPIISVGQGFFLNPSAANTWVETFTNN
jgi:hypothetical protein